MALEDEVKIRYNASGEYLINLTNPQKGDLGPTAAIDDTVLTRAANDVRADFETIIGRTYDNDDNQHVSVACEGVIAYLTLRTGQVTDGRQLREEYLTDLRRLLKHVKPQTTSSLAVTDEARGSSTAKPVDDIAAFDAMIPKPPRGSS